MTHTTNAPRPSKLNSSCQGFALAGILITLLLLAAVGAGGYLVWQRQDQPAPNQTDSPQVTNQPDNTNNQPTEDPDKYLEITEWNVRFTVPEELRGDVEHFEDESNVGWGYISFALKSVPTNDCPESDGQPNALLHTWRETPEDLRATNIPEPFKTQDDIRYYLVYSACYQRITSMISPSQKALIESLKQAIRGTLEPIPAKPATL